MVTRLAVVFSLAIIGVVGMYILGKLADKKASEPNKLTTRE